MCIRDSGYIIKDVDLITQYETGVTNLKIEKTTVYELIKQAQDLSFVKNVDVVDKDSLVSETLDVDKVKIAISIKNLLENAYKYAEKVEKIRIYLSKKDSFFNITVKDRGPGLDSELLKTITKRYVRGDHKKKEGVGLGLSICYKVMNSHGGVIEIGNNPSGGAFFTLKIPHKKLGSSKEL